MVTMETEKINPKEIVKNGYNKIAQTYQDWENHLEENTNRVYYLKKLYQLVHNNSKKKEKEANIKHILDIGCGSGLWTQKIKDNIPLSTIQAIDISETQIQLAKKNVPLLSDAFQCQDIMSFSNNNHSFDVIIGLFSFIHLSQEDQLLIFPKLYQWLNPDGLLLINLSPFEHPCLLNPNWLGAEMFWSSLGKDKYKQIIEELGFTILEWSIVEEQEDDVRIPFLWIICQKKS